MTFRERISAYSRGFLEMFLNLFLILLFLNTKTERRIEKLMAWDISVAMAAPDIPRLKVNMNIGSKIILRIAPVARPTIAKAAFPSALNMLFITKEVHMIGAPSKIYIA